MTEVGNVWASNSFDSGAWQAGSWASISSEVASSVISKAGQGTKISSWWTKDVIYSRGQFEYFYNSSGLEAALEVTADVYLEKAITEQLLKEDKELLTILYNMV